MVGRVGCELELFTSGEHAAVSTASVRHAHMAKQEAQIQPSEVARLRTNDPR